MLCFIALIMHETKHKLSNVQATLFTPILLMILIFFSHLNLTTESD